MLGKRVVRAAFAASVFLDFQTGFFDRFGQSVGGVGRIVGVAKVDAKLIGVRNVAFALSTEAFAIKLQVIVFQLLIFFFELSNHIFPARDFFLRISQLFISACDLSLRISQLLIALSECDLLFAEQFKQLRLGK
ncbi:MAG: hypothetical protein R3C28_14520 [Pirellulaceae bacterium]